MAITLKKVILKVIFCCKFYCLRFLFVFKYITCYKIIFNEELWLMPYDAADHQRRNEAVVDLNIRSLLLVRLYSLNEEPSFGITSKTW